MIEGEPKTTKSKRNIPLTNTIIEQLNKYLEYRYHKGDTLNIEKRKEVNNYLFINSMGSIPSYEATRDMFTSVLSTKQTQFTKFHKNAILLQ